MPRDYEKIKLALLRKGFSMEEAKKMAAVQTQRKRKREGRPPAKFHQ